MTTNVKKPCKDCPFMAFLRNNRFTLNSDMCYRRKPE